MSETYTAEEVQSNINILEDKDAGLLWDRKDLNRRIKDVRKQVKYWKQFDLSQYKLFNEDGSPAE